MSVSSRTAEKKPSYDDDFDSEVDEEDDDIAIVDHVTHSKGPNQRMKIGGVGQVQVDDCGGSGQEEDEDSDFEDPDDVEVPGGGKSLEIIQNLKAGETSKPSTSRAGSSSLLIKTTNQATQGTSNRITNTRSGNDDIEIVDVVPGQRMLRKPGYASFAASSRERPLVDGSGPNPFASALPAGYRGLPNFSSYYGSSPSGGNLAMPGKDSYLGNMLSKMGGVSNVPMQQPGLDLLQKSMQNGGLSGLMANPFSMLGGGSVAMASGSAGVDGGMRPGPSSSVSAGGPFQGLSKHQINSLWGMGGGSFSAGSVGRVAMSNGPYGGNYGGLMSASSLLREQREDEEVAAEDEDDMGVIETYSVYKPSKLKIGRPHPDPVVETASLASVEPTDVWYDISLPEEAVREGKLSALQLETITYASQQHERILGDGNRAGFLVGDGAGVGKGRTIAGIIFENYLKGRKRAIWISVSNDLKYDAERDLSDIGAAQIDVHFLSKMKYAKINSGINGNVKKGVIYATYSALIGESQGGGGANAANTSNKYKTRLKQLLHWCGDDFDGCVIFDECHRAKNLCPSTGAGKPTKTGQTVLELQKRLPKARVVYASATGASEPKHMAYMVRLGIWGKGSPFSDFPDFLAAVEKRGVGAMEIVAMDMKLRGMYIARQLSFAGVSFRIDEVELGEDMRKVYNASVDLWVDLMHKFEEAALLVDADKRIRKTMWGQFWSSHQRFFKYLCIASKVPHVVNVANEVIKMGKCVVIGLQSTGEARTVEALEREEELTDFVSTAKGVLQSLVEKHFPAPDRAKIDRILGRKRNIFEELGMDDRPKLLDPSKRKAKRDASAKVSKKVKYDWDVKSEENNDDVGGGGGGGKVESDYEADQAEDDDDEEDEEDLDEDVNEEEDEEQDYNPFGTDSEDEDNPWARRKAKLSKKKNAKKGKRTAGGATNKMDDHVAQILKSDKVSSYGVPSSNGSKAVSSSSSATVVPNGGLAKAEGDKKPMAVNNIDRACQMRDEIMAKIEKLGSRLPANTLDQLIDELGGPSCVSEMTGRKGRIVADEHSGEVRYESRSANGDVPLETLNLAEKSRFMNGEKDVAIISEAASSGISLQADRRVKNQKRRVHMTLELPWSADRAIQQFGRTHRSNQTSAPEYILLISDLAGEHRFASIVAKRLESLGALTHGDRRAGESRDLSRFNIDNKYGRSALEAVFKAIMGYETPLVKPPSDYAGDFFKDIADGLVGVGLITNSEDMPGMLTLDKGHSEMSKFLNRILGMHVEKQNMLFKYFSDTLDAIINQAKRTGKYDQGILDVGLTEEDRVELVRTHTFIRKHSTGKAKIELHVLTVERGLSWSVSKDKWTELIGDDEGYYLSQASRNFKKTAILAVVNEKSSKYKALSESGAGKKKKDKLFIIYRPNTGQQVKQETLSELKKKYRKVSPDEAEPHWNEQFKSSSKTCSHAYWRGNCKNSREQRCEVGLRRKTYNVLAGSVLSVWSQVEAVLTHDGNRKGTNSRMQVVRLKLENSKRIVGTLIPNSAMTALLTALDAGSEGKEETIC